MPQYNGFDTVNLSTLSGNFFGSVTSLLGMFNPTLAETGKQNLNANSQIMIPDVMTCCNAYLQGLINESQFNELCSRNGFEQRIRDFLLPLSESRLPAENYVTLYRRGIITREQLQYWLKRLQFTEHDIDKLLQVTLVQPTPSDLITFAVREVFTPETVEKFGQNEDFPSDFAKEGAKLGLSEDLMKWYWSAHWQLPSASMGFEMFHRMIDEKVDEDADEITLPSGKTSYNVIGTKTLETLLKALDIMPFWRDKITEISYNPLTRVDVRRMYGFGVLDVDDVYKSYRDQGYNDFNARKLTEFTVAYENNEFDGITRANIVKSFKDNLIDRDEMIELFQGLRYSDRAINFWVENAEWEKTLADIQAVIDDLADAYQDGQMNQQTLLAELMQMDVPGNFAETIFNRIIRKKARRNKTIPMSDLNRWLTLGVIGQEEYIQKMRLLGFKDNDIQRYLEELIQNGATGKRKYLAVTEYVSFYNNGIMSADDFYTTLREMGIAEKDIVLYAEGKKVKDAKIKESSQQIS